MKICETLQIWGIFGLLKPSTSVLVLNLTSNLLYMHFFSFLAQKMLKMTISTSVWGAQHPSAGRNIQHSKT